MWPFRNKKVDALKEEVRLLRLEQEAAKHVRPQQHKLREAFPNGWSPSYPGFGALINPNQAFYDGLVPLFAPVPAYYDYTLNMGFFVTEAWLDLLRMASRMWYATSPQAQGVTKGLSDYIIHTGYDYIVQARPNKNVDEARVKHVQRVVDDFLCANCWYERELDMFTRLRRDGEVAPRLFPQDSGVTLCRIVEPWQVRAPGKTDPEWLYGVHTEVGDRETLIGYFVTYSGSIDDGEEVSVDEMKLFKSNTDHACQRGVSDFLATEALFESSRKLLNSGVTGETVRQAIAWIEQYTGAPQGNIQSLVDSITNNQSTGVTPVVPGGAFTPTQHFAPGTIARTDSGMEFKPPPVGNSENATKMLATAYQALSVYYRVPEYMVSGNSTGGNFAQALVAESPFTRNCQREQKLMKHRYCQLVEMAVRIAEDQGVLPEGTCEVIRIQAEAPPLLVRDAKQETERNKILREANLLSDRTWSNREDLNLDEEKANQKKDGDIKSVPQDQDQTGRGIESGTPEAKYKQEVEGQK